MMIKIIRGTLAGVLFPFSIYQKLKEVSDSKKINHNGQLVKVGRHTLHADIQGTGNQTVVFDSGLGCFSLEWSYIQQQLSDVATTVSYDRAGYGWSKRNKGNATSNEIVNDLRELLKCLKLKPPYLLVGHSFGGINMRLYAQLYPNEVSGLILIDPTNEYRFSPEYIDEEKRLHYKHYLNEYRLGFLFSTLGITRLVKRPVYNKRLPIEFQSLGYRVHAYEAIYKEYRGIIQSCDAIKGETIDKEIPIVILSADKMNASWLSDQARLKELSINCRQIIVENSNHNIHFERPDIILDIIKGLIKSERTRE